MHAPTWTEEEIGLLARHIVPKGRSLNAARFKAWKLRIPFHPADPDAIPSVPPKIPVKNPTWTDPEILALQGKELPQDRTLSAAYGKAHRLHIPFNRMRKRKTPQKQKVASIKDLISAELLATRKIRATARKFGVDYTSVRNIAKELNLCPFRNP